MNWRVPECRATDIHYTQLQLRLTPHNSNAECIVHVTCTAHRTRILNCYAPLASHPDLIMQTALPMHPPSFVRRAQGCIIGHASLQSRGRIRGRNVSRCARAHMRCASISAQTVNCARYAAAAERSRYARNTGNDQIECIAVSSNADVRTSHCDNQIAHAKRGAIVV